MKLTTARHDKIGLDELVGWTWRLVAIKSFGDEAKSTN